MRQFGRPSAEWFVLVVLALAVALAGCDDSDDESDTAPDTALVLTVTGGNLQSAFVADPLIDPLTVRATRADGTPVAALPIRFTRRTGDGEAVGEVLPDTLTAETDAAGYATAQFEAGARPGLVRVVAQDADDVARPATFTLSVYPRPESGRQPVCFLSINDFHSHLTPWGPPDDPQGGLARIAWAFQTIRAANDRIGVPTVIFDAGDDFENTIYHDVPGMLSWLISVWDRAGVDVWQVGNHDFHFGLPFLTEQVIAARERFEYGAKGHPMNVTFGNVDPSTLRPDLAYLKKYFETDFDDSASYRLYEQTTIVHAGPLRVGVLGVVTDKGVYTQVPGDPAFLRILGAGNPYAEKLTYLSPDPRKDRYINKGIDALDAEDADVVVVLSHTGLGFGDRTNLPPGYDDLIALYAKGRRSKRAVDLLISGHSHVQLNHPIYVPNQAGFNTPIVQAREGGLFIARVDAMVDRVIGSTDVIDSRLIQVNRDLAEDPQTADEVDYWREQVDALHPGFRTETLAEMPVWASHRAETISGLGNVINDAFRWKSEEIGEAAETSIVIPSLYRTDLWPGPITPELAYEVLSMHKMDEVGTNPDTLAVLTIRPGLADWSALFLPGTWKTETSAIEFMLEIVHTLPELLGKVPMIDDEFKIDTVQIDGVSYEVDLSAPMFEHVVDGSVTIDGEPVDPDRTYRMVVVETFAQQMAYAMNAMLIGWAPGEGLVRPVVVDPLTDVPYVDTQVPIWQALADYLAQLPDGEVPLEDLTVTGDVLRTVQPDLVVNGAEMAVRGARRGETATATARVRNVGMTAVESATVRLLVDVTPWDTTDQDDGRSVLEGFGEDYLGSLTEIGRQVVSVPAYPGLVDVAIEWTVPETLSPGLYTLHARIDDLVADGIDPNTNEPYADAYPDNDSGEQVMAYFEVR